MNSTDRALSADPEDRPRSDAPAAPSPAAQGRADRGGLADADPKRTLLAIKAACLESAEREVDELKAAIAVKDAALLEMENEILAYQGEAEHEEPIKGWLAMLRTARATSAGPEARSADATMASPETGSGARATNDTEA